MNSRAFFHASCAIPHSKICHWDCCHRRAAKLETERNPDIHMLERSDLKEEWVYFTDLVFERTAYKALF